MSKIEKLSDIENEEEFLKAYHKANEDLVELRAELKALEKEKKALEEAAEALSPEALNKMKARAIRAELKAQLEADGIKNADRILKYMDLEGVDYDENDEITGADEKLDAIKNDFPELFDVKKRAGRENVDIHADNPVKTQKSTTEAQVDALFA